MTHDWVKLEYLAFVLALFYICVLAAVAIDMYFGIRRAKAGGVTRTSIGFRRTLVKTQSYFGLLALMTLIDVIASEFTELPYFTALVSIGIILVELKSVFENIRSVDKGVEQVPEAIREIVKNKDHLQALLGYLNNEVREKREL